MPKIDNYLYSGSGKMKIFLVYQDDKSHKFWHIEQNNKSVIVRYGKVGNKGRSQTKIFDTLVQATQYVTKSVKQKKNKGYSEQTQVTTAGDSSLFEDMAVGSHFLYIKRHKQPKLTDVHVFVKTAAQDFYYKSGIIENIIDLPIQVFSITDGLSEKLALVQSLNKQGLEYIDDYQKFITTLAIEQKTNGDVLRNLEDYLLYKLSEHEDLYYNFTAGWQSIVGICMQDEATRMNQKFDSPDRMLQWVADLISDKKQQGYRLIIGKDRQAYIDAATKLEQQRELAQKKQQQQFTINLPKLKSALKQYPDIAKHIKVNINNLEEILFFEQSTILTDDFKLLSRYGKKIVWVNGDLTIEGNLLSNYCPVVVLGNLHVKHALLGAQTCYIAGDLTCDEFLWDPPYNLFIGQKLSAKAYIDSSFKRVETFKNLPYIPYNKDYLKDEVFGCDTHVAFEHLNDLLNAGENPFVYGQTKLLEIAVNNQRKELDKWAHYDQPKNTFIRILDSW